MFICTYKVFPRTLTVVYLSLSPQVEPLKPHHPVKAETTKLVGLLRVME